MTEFLVAMEFSIPATATDAHRDSLISRESVRARQLIAQGMIVRMWRPRRVADEWRNIGLWRASDRVELDLALASLPLADWASITVTELADHPSDPLRQSVD